MSQNLPHAPPPLLVLPHAPPQSTHRFDQGGFLSKDQFLAKFDIQRSLKDGIISVVGLILPVPPPFDGKSFHLIVV